MSLVYSIKYDTLPYLVCSWDPLSCCILALLLVEYFYVIVFVLLLEKRIFTFLYFFHHCTFITFGRQTTLRQTVVVVPSLRRDFVYIPTPLLL